LETLRAHVDMEWPERSDEEPETRETTGALRSWLVRGTHKVAVHPRRRTGRHQGARELLAADAGWLPGDRSGWKGLVSALQRHSVLHALARLRKGDRDILTMAYLEGHTNDEIGRMLRVSARTVSRRLVAALSQLEEHARDVGIWLAAFALVALGVVSRPQETYWRVAGALRSDRWTLAGAIGTATVVTAASIAVLATSPASPLTGPSTFSPEARSINAAVTFVQGAVVSSSPVTVVVVPAIEPGGATHKSKPAHDSLTATAPTTANGCGGNPTDAPAVTPVGPRGEGPHTSPVTHPGPGGCGPHAGKTVPSGH
jgi:RNA polymerase sigma factor (sigma-70 family)